MAMAHLQRAGHKPIAIIGGGTTMIGDPTDKTEMRPMLSQEQIASSQTPPKNRCCVSPKDKKCPTSLKP